MRTNVIYDYPSEYKEFLIHFHGTRDYFECHEILEEYWLEQNRDIQWLALIQLAVAVYHERQENYAGSLKLYRRVLGHLETEKSRFERLSIDVPQLKDQIEERLFLIKTGMPYYPMNLPVTDEKLIAECRDTAEKREIEWNKDDRSAGKELVFRHRLRDRTEVIQARSASLLEKQTKRQY